MSDCSTAVPRASTFGSFMLYPAPRNCGLCGRRVPLFPNVGNFDHDALADLPLVSRRPVLITRLHQSVCRIGYGRGAVGESRIDERRLADHACREAVIQLESRLSAVGQIRRRRVALEAENRRAALTERHAGIVDAVAASDHLLVRILYANPNRGPDGIDRNLVEGSGPGPALPLYRRISTLQAVHQRRDSVRRIEG